MSEANKPCPPTSQRVMEVLDAAEGPLSPTQLIDRTGLKRRTLYEALSCLSRQEMVRVGTSLRDARRRRYVIQDGLQRGLWRKQLLHGETPPGRTS